jgi:alpha-N-arabinofuranosidase
VIAPIFTSPSGLFLQTIYHPLRLYAEHTQAIALDPHVDCGTYDLMAAGEVPSLEHKVADLGPFKLLDVSATRDAAGQLVTLGVVNRDRDEAIPTTVQLGDGVRIAGVVASEVNGANPFAINSFDRPNEVAVREREVAASGDRFDYTFPAHSLTILRLRLGR